MGSHLEFAISLVTGSTPVFSPTHHDEGATRRKAANNPISAIAHPYDGAMWPKNVFCFGFSERYKTDGR